MPIISEDELRDEADLPKNGLDNVWTSWNGYPEEEIPDNVVRISRQRWN
jgi:hypothetical protein